MTNSVRLDSINATPRKIFSEGLTSETSLKTSDLAVVIFSPLFLVAAINNTKPEPEVATHKDQEGAILKPFLAAKKDFVRLNPVQRLNNDMVVPLQLTLREAAFGSKKKVAYQIHGAVKEITVKTPPGISTGKKLRLAGKGSPNSFGGPPGDLYLNVEVLDDPVFQRDGDDLSVEKKIKFTEAVLGTTIEVPTLDGNKTVKVPPGTQGNTKIRLKGFGMPNMEKGEKGDLYVKIVLGAPKNLTKKQRELIENLAAEGL